MKKFKLHFFPDFYIILCNTTGTCTNQTGKLNCSNMEIVRHSNFELKTVLIIKLLFNYSIIQAIFIIVYSIITFSILTTEENIGFGNVVAYGHPLGGQWRDIPP